MAPGVRWYLVSSTVLFVLIALAGCSHYLFAEREAWRREAEITCLNSGAFKESATAVRIASISGPGACGIDYPLKVSALGDSAPLGYDDEPLRPPSSIPDAALPPHWPVIESRTLPPQPDQPQATTSPYGGTRYDARRQALGAGEAAPQWSARRSPTAGRPPPDEDAVEIPDGPLQPYYGAAAPSSAPTIDPRPLPPPSLGPPTATASIAPVEVSPPATLACPIVSALDQWIDRAVQPAALRWFHQPVVEIKQISAYSCRGMNGDPNADISEHAFGNALDIAEFDLADGHRISVQYGWHGTPQEQGFLHDVQASACDEFTTVLAPGANIYHYNHIHVDLMQRASGRRICEPAPVAGAVAAERARGRYASRHGGDPGVTGAITPRTHDRALGFAGTVDDHLPLAVPGQD